MKDNFLISFKNSYLLVPVIILFSLVIVYIEGKISRKEVSRKNYVKISFLTGIISTFIVYIHNIDGRIEEDILSGPPPF